MAVITQSLAREAEALSRLRQAMAIAIPAALVVAAAIGYLLALRSLAPVSRMTEVASRIEAENLSERVDFAHPSDELGRLGAPSPMRAAVRGSPVTIGSGLPKRRAKPSEKNRAIGSAG